MAMTIEEIGLLRAIAVARREMGVNYSGDPFPHWRSPENANVMYDKVTGHLGMRADNYAGPIIWVGPAGVTQAVDILVAFGYLPARFSSAYRAGREELQREII